MAATLERSDLVLPMSMQLDAMFAAVEETGTPEGYRWQIVEGQVVMSPQLALDSHLIFCLVGSVEDFVGRRSSRVLSDVRADFPGYLNGFAPDAMLVAEGAKPIVGDFEEEHYRYQDVQVVAEVVSKSSCRTDHGVKLTTYAEADIPVYVIVDPFKALITAFSEPLGGVYQMINTHHFGAKFTLPDGKGIVVDTAHWPRD